MNTNSTLSAATRSVHGNVANEGEYPSRVRHIAPEFGSLEQAEKRFATMNGNPYARGGHVIQRELEDRFVALAGGKAAVSLASGQAGCALAFQALLRGGGDIIVSNHIFGGTFGLLKDMEADRGIRAHWVDPSDAAAIGQAVQNAADPRAIFVESISNPDNLIADLDGIAAVAAKYRVPFVVDNTLGLTLCDPFAHGANIVVVSATKLAVGHNSLLSGMVIDGGNFPWDGDERYKLLTAVPPGGLSLVQEFGDSAFAAAVRKLMVLYGPTPSVADATSTIDYLSTAVLRVERQARNAEAVARFLQKHPAVSLVQYPGIGNDKANDERAARYFPDGAGAVVTFNLKGGRDAAVAFFDRIKVIAHRANVGQLETIATAPNNTTHRQFGAEEKRMARIEAGTIRLSVGIEAERDIIADLERALTGG